MNLTNIRNPIYGDADHTVINVIVDTDEYRDIPFTASPNDPLQHGVNLYNELISGVYGIITSYVAPSTTQPTVSGVQKL